MSIEIISELIIVINTMDLQSNMVAITSVSYMCQE
jgi:hypothetical protein